MTRLREAVVTWAAAGTDASTAGVYARELAVAVTLRTVVLVEGVSDQVAVERLAIRRGRDLAAEGVCVVPLGGATSIGRFLTLLGPRALDVAVAGLCDLAEQAFFDRALERAGLASEGFFVCDADLEHELIRAVGLAGVETVIEAQGDLRALRTFQRQPAQRSRSSEDQLHRFMGSIGGRKARYAGALVDALELDRVPQPLDDLLAHV
ncbi:TOPRIM nucleotidyl transferase/hydrolase domain-containing protein [Aeromicrobium sp.]|uniref:TOPRIM nucleotidyl transferase/hydrolase domain-containing protein n=1 Tax=Aeromicrobium sp. TaxID=1871063 RepID=UPI0030C4E816